MLALRRAAASLAPRLLAQEATPSLSAAFNCLGGSLQREQQQQPSASVAYRGEPAYFGSLGSSAVLAARSRGQCALAWARTRLVGGFPAATLPIFTLRNGHAALSDARRAAKGLAHTGGRRLADGPSAPRSADSFPFTLPLSCAAYATTTELAAAQAAGLTPTAYAMKNPTPAITCVWETACRRCRRGRVVGCSSCP